MNVSEIVVEIVIQIVVDLFEPAGFAGPHSTLANLAARRRNIACPACGGALSPIAYPPPHRG